MTNPFKKATKEKAYLRLALVGISGSGKTYSALNIARYLVPGGAIAVIDTEHGSARKYADQFTFDVVELNTFSPDSYIEMINAASSNGYGVLIIDSLSHAWVGEGGVLELVNKTTLASKSKNAYTEGWSKGTPAQNRLIEAILAAPCHIIVTMRAKSDYIMVEDKFGKSAPKKIGLAPVQREGVEYEFDVLAEMNLDHTLIVEKTRCPKLDSATINKPGQEIADTLRAWLSDGDEPAPAQNPVSELVQSGSAPQNGTGTVESTETSKTPEKAKNESVEHHSDKSVIHDMQTPEQFTEANRWVHGDGSEDRLDQVVNNCILVWKQNEDRNIGYIRAYKRIGKIIGSTMSPKNKSEFQDMMRLDCGMTGNAIVIAAGDYVPSDAPQPMNS